MKKVYDVVIVKGGAMNGFFEGDAVETCVDKEMAINEAIAYQNEYNAQGIDTVCAIRETYVKEEGEQIDMWAIEAILNASPIENVDDILAMRK